MQAKSYWSDAEKLIRSEMTDASYHAYVEPLKPLAVMGDSLVLQSPNVLIKNTLDKYYFDTLRDSVLRAHSTLHDLLIVLPEEAEQYLPASDASGVSCNDLNPRYTFDSFVVGSSNQFAHAAALAVAKKPAQSYNPLFLYGGVGLGKTHLMHAVGNYVKEHSPSYKVMYVTSETFTNEMIQSISSNRNKEFRNRYRNVDLLMVDDIQFISKKEGVQEEFFHTFNALHGANKQIIISSDRNPKEIAQLELRLRSRFEWGLVADLQFPSLETRVAILKKNAQTEDIRISDDVLMYIAERVKTNIRELEGSLNRVVAYSDIYQKEYVDMSIAEEALKDILPDNKPKELSADFIKSTVADFYNIDVSSLSEKRRDRSIAFPRQVVMYLCRELTPLSSDDIGDALGGRDHSTVLHGIKNISQQIEFDSSLRKTVEDLKKRLRE